MAGPLDRLIGRVVDVWEKRATVCLAGQMCRHGRVEGGALEVRAGCSAGPLEFAVGLDEVLDREV